MLEEGVHLRDLARTNTSLFYLTVSDEGVNINNIKFYAEQKALDWTEKAGKNTKRAKLRIVRILAQKLNFLYNTQCSDCYLLFYIISGNCYA